MIRRSHGTHGLLCSSFCGWDGFWPWKKLGTAIISDGEDGLVWVWSCPMCGQTLKTEPFAFPADMPDFTSSQSDPENAQGDWRGTDRRHLGYNAK